MRLSINDIKNRSFDVVKLAEIVYITEDNVQDLLELILDLNERVVELSATYFSYSEIQLFDEDREILRFKFQLIENLLHVESILKCETYGDTTYPIRDLDVLTASFKRRSPSLLYDSYCIHLRHLLGKN